MAVRIRRVALPLFLAALLGGGWLAAAAIRDHGSRGPSAQDASGRHDPPEEGRGHFVLLGADVDLAHLEGALGFTYSGYWSGSAPPDKPAYCHVDLGAPDGTLVAEADFRPLRPSIDEGREVSGEVPAEFRTQEFALDDTAISAFCDTRKEIVRRTQCEGARTLYETKGYESFPPKPYFEAYNRWGTRLFRWRHRARSDPYCMSVAAGRQRIDDNSDGGPAEFDPRGVLWIFGDQRSARLIDVVYSTLPQPIRIVDVHGYGYDATFVLQSIVDCNEVAAFDLRARDFVARPGWASGARYGCPTP